MQKADKDSLLINELMPELLEMLEEMLDSSYICWQKKDLAGLQSLAHDIKGTAGMYGLLAISQLAARLEELHGNTNMTACLTLFSSWRKNVRQIKDQFLGKLQTT